MCQGYSEGSPGLRKAALGAQVYGLRPGSLEHGPVWSGCMSSPGDTPAPAMFSRSVHESQ